MPLPGAPLNLTEADRKNVIDYLDQAFQEALPAHDRKIERLDRWQRAYDGIPATPHKDFPWPGACNIVIPLIGIAVDSIVARIVNTLFSVTPFWSVRPLRSEVEEAAYAQEQFLEWSRHNEFNIYSEVRQWVPEIVKYGWGYMKVNWDVATQTTVMLDNGLSRPEQVVVRRPYPHHVLLRDIVTQPGIEDDLGQAEWIAQRVRLTDGQMAIRERDGIFQDTDAVISNKSRTLRTVDGISPINKLNEFYEVWATIPIAVDDKIPVPVVLTYHPGTRTLLRAIHNPNFDGTRAFVKAKFIEREGELEGQGIAARLSDMQSELTTIHCQQVDNSTIANTRFFLGRRGVVRAGTRIWPGRFLTVPDPANDVKAVQMGDVLGSMTRLSAEILAFSERASGVSDPSLGRESSTVGTRATATGTLAILQEGNRRFDLNVRDIRDSLGTIGVRVLNLNQQYRPRGVAFTVLGDRGQLVEQLLDLPNRFMNSMLAVELTASTATINREVEKRSLTELLGLLANYYQQSLQVATLVENQQVPPSVRQLAVQELVGGRVVMQRLLQTYDIQSIDKVLPKMGAATDIGMGADNGPAGQ